MRCGSSRSRRCSPDRASWRDSCPGAERSRYQPVNGEQLLGRQTIAALDQADRTYPDSARRSASRRHHRRPEAVAQPTPTDPAVIRGSSSRVQNILHRDSRAGDPDLHTHVAVANSDPHPHPSRPRPCSPIPTAAVRSLLCRSPTTPPRSCRQRRDKTRSQKS
jgi:TrwC relaxase